MKPAPSSLLPTSRKRRVITERCSIPTPRRLSGIAVDFRQLNQSGVDALTFSSHKLGGPKSAAALVIDKRIDDDR